MSSSQIHNLIDELSIKNTGRMYNNDFLLTWEKSGDEIDAVIKTAQILKLMRSQNISPRIFNTGLAVSIFRDNSTRTRYSFASASNLLGLAVQDLDETKSQIAHGETVRETANMLSFLSDVIGIRDDMFLGEGNKYMREVSEAVQEGYEKKILPKRPVIVNLQCDKDHPTQSMSDLLHLVNHFGGKENLSGKKIAMTWAYSPSYGKPLSVPQGIIGLMSRFGMEVTLACPSGYSLIPDVVKTAEENSRKSSGDFTVTNSMEKAFKNADIVYPKSWAPYSVMEQRTELLRQKDSSGLKELEKQCLNNNKKHIHWECTEKLMEKTNNALYMHCLPADISGVSCERGEVEASVFERQRINTYMEAGYKPYIIASMILLSKVKNPVTALRKIMEKSIKREYYPDTE
jgi:knotted carbamoyltransferase YgeW